MVTSGVLPDVKDGGESGGGGGVDGGAGFLGDIGADLGDGRGGVGDGDGEGNDGAGIVVARVLRRPGAAGLDFGAEDATTGVVFAR